MHYTGSATRTPASPSTHAEKIQLEYIKLIYCRSYMMTLTFISYIPETSKLAHVILAKSRLMKHIPEGLSAY